MSLIQIQEAIQLKKQIFELHTKQIRKNIIEMVFQAQSGHIGGSFSATEILTYLYFVEMKIDTSNVKSIERDRFVLSKGHASPLLYATLAEKGFLKKEELASFRHINSRLQGHPNKTDLEGVDMSTGSLAQGFSAAVGMALADQIDHKIHRIYVLLGDGECEEGEVWEAAMCAAHYRLDHLCAIIDHNNLQIDGDIEEVMNPNPLDKKFEAFGWNVEYANGHEYVDLKDAFAAARSCKGKPTMILANTIKGKGVSFMENNVAWHGGVPNIEQYEQALLELESGCRNE